MNMEQKRAKHAWEVIQRLLQPDGTPVDHGSEFRTEALKVSARVMTAGLGQAVAFLLSKSADDNVKSKGVKALLGALNSWVCGSEAGLNPKIPKSLMLSIANGDTLFLVRATEETLAYIQWINRFTEAAGIKRSAE